MIATLADGADPATTRVADYMTDQPVTVRPDEDVKVAARRMTELGVRHLPVVDRDQLVGVLSIRDLLAPGGTDAYRPDGPVRVVHPSLERGRPAP